MFIAIGDSVNGGTGTGTGVGPPPLPTQFLLQEDSFKIYLENGVDFLLTE
jgi:hypothetical protein